MAEKHRPKIPGSGRKKGSANVTSRSVRETFQETFEMLQQHKTANLTNWALENRSQFYQLAAKLIPANVALQGALTLNVVTGVPKPGVDDLVD